MQTNEFKLSYNVTGAERKRLVQTIAKVTGAQPEYLGAPSFAYRVGYCTIDKKRRRDF